MARCVVVSTLDDCYPWQPGGCEWTIRFLWRWMSSFGRLDVIVLALMLAYLFAVVIQVSCRCYIARRARGIDNGSRRILAAALNIELGSLKSIAVTAPYLGLVGTCEGILNAFGGVGMEKHAAMAMIMTRIALALIPTAAAIPVAVLATCSYNYLPTRIDLLQSEAFDQGQQRCRHFRGARGFPPTKRFSDFPAFGLSAAPALAILIAAYTTLASFPTPTGFYVELASARCESDGVDKLIVLHITDSGELFFNQDQTDWNSLADRLSQIYSVRVYRTLYLLADPGVPFQTVAHAIDTVENAPTAPGPKSDSMRKDKLGIKVRLITPKAFDAGCPTGSGHLVLR
jgi:biopolymer transport protein ExbD